MQETTPELKRAFEKYQDAKKKLEESKDDHAIFPRIAQEANQAWLEFKKLNREFENHSIMKQLGELYGC